MSEPNEEKKHVTEATTSEPQEEFIEQKARPSRDESEVRHEAPPKEPTQR
jgi:hypothetical protein